LVPGIHPFGDKSDNSTQNNITEKNPVNFDRKCNQTLEIMNHADVSI
jgi:hypothetical protein